MTDSQSVALIIGASSEIGQALIRRLLQDDGVSRIVAVSRSRSNPLLQEQADRLEWLQSDYSEESIAKICRRFRDLPEQGECIDRVFILNGVLHNNELQPEKRLEDLSGESLHEVFQINAVGALLWLKHLKPILRGKRERIITVLSARVGSIDDNQRGGWYAYRASKAALNMLLKTAAIEYRRTAKNTRFLAFHPGTTDTPLSKPFQGSVPADKLFTPDFVAERLLTVAAELTGEHPIEFRAWDGETVPW